MTAHQKQGARNGTGPQDFRLARRSPGSVRKRMVFCFPGHPNLSYALRSRFVHCQFLPQSFERTGVKILAMFYRRDCPYDSPSLYQRSPLWENIVHSILVQQFVC